MESAREGESSQSTGTHSASTSDESILSHSSKKLVSSRSSSVDSGAFEEELGRPSVSDALSGFSANRPSAVSGSDLESDSNQNLQPPVVQSMENHGGGASPYRIPSSVFARTSQAPGEWSVASNESLFSIQMGTMSFTRDFAQYLGKSGELGLYRKSGDLSMYKKSGELGADMKLAVPNKSGELTEHRFSDEIPNMRPTTTGEMMNLANCPQAAYQPCSNSHPGLGATEAVAAETMKEVIRENEQNRGEMKVPSQKYGGSSHTSSDDGGASVKSFTFPISGDSVKNGSEDISLRPQKSTQHSQQTPDSIPRSISKGKPSDAPQLAHATSWFSCCWPVRS